LTHPGTRPATVGENEKWIDVSISSQTLVAFVGDKAVFGTLVSTGRTSSDKSQDHPTPVGMWRIREKHIASTMDGDVASDGPYSIEDVPWIMYFNGSYAIHGAFWHAEFGRKKSHGCVNMSPVDAKAMFEFAEPKLKRGWHAAWSTPSELGTMVVVHD
ncbi:MAG: L,D-transpeptidase, partial [Proteobacteria bacterium]